MNKNVYYVFFMPFLLYSMQQSQIEEAINNNNAYKLMNGFNSEKIKPNNPEQEKLDLEKLKNLVETLIEHHESQVSKKVNRPRITDYLIGGIFLGNEIGKVTVSSLQNSGYINGDQALLILNCLSLVMYGAAGCYKLYQGYSNRGVKDNLIRSFAIGHIINNNEQLQSKIKELEAINDE